MSQASQLLVVAHPDDETIFFGGTVMTLGNRKWKLIVITDGNADGQGKARHQQLADACKELGIREFEQWKFADRYESRLDTDAIIAQLAAEKPRVVWTHGILGEYGHPHHQDVSYAVHKRFRNEVPVWSVAYNSFASKNVRLTRKIFERKSRILSQIYQSETLRFASQLPLYNHEGFHRTDWPEIDHLYGYWTDQRQEIDPGKLKQYRWYIPYLNEQKRVAHSRPF